MLYLAIFAAFNVISHIIFVVVIASIIFCDEAAYTWSQMCVSIHVGGGSENMCCVEAENETDPAAVALEADAPGKPDSSTMFVFTFGGALRAVFGLSRRSALAEGTWEGIAAEQKEVNAGRVSCEVKIRLEGFGTRATGGRFEADGSGAVEVTAAD